MITISRIVNDRGLVDQKTDGRGNTTNYTYNDLGQLTGIEYPVHDDLVIEWTATGRETARGASKYKEVKTFDGFDRPISVTTSDLSTGSSVVKTFGYDALGRTIFESYPNSAASAIGTTYQYDEIGRTKKIINPDNSFITYDYAADSLQVDVTNERGFKTKHDYRAFGDPAQKALMAIHSPEAIDTVFTRDGLDRIRNVTQGGLVHTYTYNHCCPVKG